MKKAIWFMEGLSSQRDIIKQIVAYFGGNNVRRDYTVVASHRDNRAEILSVADYAYIEPKDAAELLIFMKKIIDKHNVVAIQAGNRNRWFEKNRATIEALGVKLVTGAKSLASLDLADDKVAFAARMEEIGLPVVPSLRVRNAEDLEDCLKVGYFNGAKLCIKPVKGIYGMGFWILDPEAKAAACFANPDNRVVHPSVYLNAVKQHWPEEMVLMPYLPGDEYSVDMLVDDGKVLLAVGRCKQGSIQQMYIDGPAVELAKKCASAMRADGLVNVQTKLDDQGNHLLLEINMRPSGGIGYGLASNIDIPSAFAHHMLIGLDDTRLSHIKACFRPATVRAHSTVLAVPDVDFSKQCVAGV
ncbi:ATP-grasp domain-containing protein [Aeromonas sp. MrichA-1]|uniref:ATP-grasp domain-containing protein n=1 Tax=Aeromonas sp. MrichA-1 TaxID=2823362 RepID=UPI001B32974C|nr:ATP-grasp domain-containing protein [Aeromonas sp. MrichA-1]MBP4081879.1 ATP-grasp domain-containing protein [Aeromonas sp. MrichA-1]